MSDAEKMLMQITAILQDCERFWLSWDGYKNPEGRTVTVSCGWGARCKDGSEICDYDVWEKVNALDMLIKQKRVEKEDEDEA